MGLGWITAFLFQSCDTLKLVFLNECTCSLSLGLSVTVSGMKTTLKRPIRMSVFIGMILRMRGRWRWWFHLRKRRRVLQRTRSSLWTSASPWTRPRCTCKYFTLSIGLTCGGRALADLACPTAHLCAPNAVRSLDPNIVSSQLHMHRQTHAWFYWHCFHLDLANGQASSF